MSNHNGGKKAVNKTRHEKLQDEKCSQGQHRSTFLASTKTLTIYKIL